MTRNDLLYKAGRRPATRLMPLGVGLVALLLTAAACGSSSHSQTASTGAPSTGASGSAPSGSTQSSSAQSGSAPSGSPIVTMTVASVDYNGPTYESGLITAKAFANYVNSRGGINGHPLDAMTCDEKGTAAGSQACAQQAVAKHAVAMVGSPTFYGYAEEGVLHAANPPISEFGECCSFAPAEWNDSTAYTFDPDAIEAGRAGLEYMVKSGCKNISYMAVNVPSTKPSFDSSLKLVRSDGYSTPIRLIEIPLTGTDYTSYMAQATNANPDCVALVATESEIPILLPEFFATGSTARLFGSQGNFDTVAVKGYQNRPQVKDAVIEGFYEDLNSPAYADYRQALAAYSGTNKALDYDSLSGLGTWAAFKAFADVASHISGAVTATSFLAQAAKTTNVNTGGELGTLNLANPGKGYPPITRVFNHTLFYFHLDGTEVATVTVPAAT